MTVPMLFVIAACICFGLAAAGVSSRVGLVPLGLLLVTVAALVL